MATQIAPALKTRIDEIVAQDKVVLFMKGTPQMPQCGFSATTVGLLGALVPSYTTFNVLDDQDVREGIKAYSDWPTIPQLYIDNEFVGGCDIVKQMFNTGELHEMLGVEAPDRTPPEITLSDEAAEVIRGALDGQPEGANLAVHLTIDAQWNHNFQLGPRAGHEVIAKAGDIEMVMDVATAQRARGLSIAMTESIEGKHFQIENPNAPPPVKLMKPETLKSRREAGEPLHLFDVRPETERARASLDGAIPLDGAGQAQLEALPKDSPLVFMCHVGQRSMAAAEHFRMQGYTEVYNLAGGIDAYSRDADSSVPRY